MKCSRAVPFIVSTLVALAGCASTVDRDQARLCRLALVALSDPDETLKIGAQRDAPVLSVSGASPFEAAGQAIHVEATARRPNGSERPTYADCLFGAGRDRRLLVALRTPGGRVSLPRLFALNRFWLTSDDAQDADPMPVEGEAAIRLPINTAYAVQQAVNAIPGCAIYVLLAAAYSLIYGLIGRINLAFGAFAAIGGTATITIVLALGNSPLAITLATAGLAALIPAACYGLAASRIVFQPLQKATGQQVLVATIGLAFALGEFLRLAQGPQSRWIEPVMNTPMALARDQSFVVTVTPIVLIASAAAIVVTGALLFAMRYTEFGRQWRAYRDDPVAAALFGVGLNDIFMRSFALASALAGLSGGIVALMYGDMTFAYAQVIGLKALTAAIIGGIGSVPGAVLGGLFIGLVESGWSATFSIANRDLVVFCMLVATLMCRPGGFFGEPDLLPRRV